MFNPASALFAGHLQRVVACIPDEVGIKKKGVVAVHRKGSKVKATTHADGSIENEVDSLLYVIFETDNVDYSRKHELDPEDFFRRHLKGHSDDELDDIRKKIQIISSHILHNEELSQRFNLLKEVAEKSISQHRKVSKRYLECYRKRIRGRLKEMKEELEVKKPRGSKWLFSLWERDKEEDLFAKDYFRDIIDEYEYQKESGNIIEKETSLKGRQFVVEQIKDIINNSDY